MDISLCWRAGHRIRLIVFPRVFFNQNTILCELWEELDAAIKSGTCDSFFNELRVTAETAAQCLYLCEFYFHNTIPFLEIVSEQDKLSGERKLVELLVNKYDDRAGHSALLNVSHMKKREFKECIETLMEREAIIAESEKKKNGKTAKAYVLANAILESWKA